MNSDEVRRRWASRCGEYSPRYYAYYGPNETSEAVRRSLDRLVDSTATVLEVGCSAGRHLAHLHDQGYENLHGLDINEDAYDVMAEAYPALADDVSFYAEAIEEAAPRFDDGRFDAVFSVETLQHVHADHTDVFSEIARITRDGLVTVESESSGSTDPTHESPVNFDNGDFPLYYRPWGRIFTNLGLDAIDSRGVDGNTLRTFRKRGE